MSIISGIIDLFSLLAKLIGTAGTMAISASRRRELREWAAARGLRFHRSDRTLTTRMPFELFMGKRGAAVNVVAVGDGATLFDFIHGSGASTQIQTCVVMPVDLSGPAVRIAPRVIESVQRVPFESHAFNSRFTVTSADPLFASAIVDQRMMEWLLAQTETWRVEIRGGRLLCSAPLLPTARLEQMVTFARAFRERIPAVARTIRSMPA